MFKSLRSPYLTRALMEHLTDPLLPYAGRICELLEKGARPWALAPPAAPGLPDRSLLYMIALRSPDQRCMDAWFDRVGTIRGEPWQAHGVPNPFHEWVEYPPQPGVFMARNLRRLFQAGLQPTAPAGEKLGPWLQRHCSQEFPQMLRAIAQHFPAVLLDPDEWEREQITNPVFVKLAAQVGSKQMAEETPPAANLPPPSPLRL